MGRAGGWEGVGVGARVGVGEGGRGRGGRAAAAARSKCLVAESIHFTLFGIILPTIKLKVYTVGGL